MTIVNILYSGLGGHSSVVFSFVEADQSKLYEHVILFYGIEKIPQSYIDKCQELSVPYYFIEKRPGLDLDSYSKVEEVLKQVKPKVVMLHSVNLIWPVQRFTKKYKVKLIAIEHQSNQLKTKKDWLSSMLVMFLADKVVYLTELYALQMKKRLSFLYRSRKVSVINNGINTSLFKPIKDPAATPSIGMLSRLAANKDHLTLIKAFALVKQRSKHPELRLKIAGDGHMKQTFLTCASQMQVAGSVDFLGMIPEHGSPAFLNSLDIYVHASFGETMSTSLMQAMACACPIIASDVEGINNMILPGKTGLLVETQNVEAWANQIEELLVNPQLQHQLGKNALLYSQEHFSNSVMFNRYRKLFV